MSTSICQCCVHLRECLSSSLNMISCTGWKGDSLKLRDRAEKAEARVAELEKVLEEIRQEQIKAALEGKK